MQQHANEIARKMQGLKITVSPLRATTQCSITQDVHDYITHPKTMENTLRLIQSTQATMQAAQITPEVAQQIQSALGQFQLYMQQNGPSGIPQQALKEIIAAKKTLEGQDNAMIGLGDTVIYLRQATRNTQATFDDIQESIHDLGQQISRLGSTSHGYEHYDAPQTALARTAIFKRGPPSF